MEDLTKARHLSPAEVEQLRREAKEASQKMKAIIKKRKAEEAAKGSSTPKHK